MKINRREFFGICGVSALSLFSSCPKSSNYNLSELELKTKFFSLMNKKYDFQEEVNKLNKDKSITKELFYVPLEDKEMKACAFYNNEQDYAPLVVLIPGFSAGGSIYFKYAQDLANNFRVIVPDLPGDYIHFLGLQVLKDPLIKFDKGHMRECCNNLLEEINLIPGYENYSSFIDAIKLIALEGMFGKIQDEQVTDLIRKHIFGYRMEGIDPLMQSAIYLNEDSNSGLFGRINSEIIGMEGHSLAGDDLIQSVVKINGEQLYSWSNKVKAIISKGGTVGLQDLDRVKSIPSDVSIAFFSGEYDIDMQITDRAWERFNILEGKSIYLELNHAGHMFEVDPPIGLLGEKIPMIGSPTITIFDYIRSREVNKNFSSLFFDSFLNSNLESTQILSQGIDIDGQYYTRNF